MKQIPIIFQGGSYGTYLLWVLTMLFTDEKLHDPFVKNTGPSHNMHNVRSLDINVWLDDNDTLVSGMFLKVHAKLKNYHSLLDNITKLTSHFGKSILIYPSYDTYLLNSNNYVYKIWDDLWTGPLGYIDKENLYNNFPITRGTPLEEVPVWIIREWLSYNFFNAINDQIEWGLPGRLKNDNCLIIYIDELLYRLPTTIAKIQHFLEMPLTKDINSILPYHDKNLSLQKYLGQDKLASDIINSIKENTELLTWNQSDLTIITESWIQQWIRNAGYDFKCFELNQFPTTSKKLIQLL